MLYSYTFFYIKKLYLNKLQIESFDLKTLTRMPNNLYKSPNDINPFTKYSEELKIPLLKAKLTQN
jgi:hypothetical protein